MSFSPRFQSALRAACADGGTLAEQLEGADCTEGDLLALSAALCEEYAPDLGEGGPPRAYALLAIVTLALQTGVRLERQRHSGPA
jgi:hypothetical protein